MNSKCWGAVAVAGVLAVTGASSGAGGQAGRAAPTQQVLTPVEGDPPPFRFGYTPDWYANELRRDMEEAERLQKEGRTERTTDGWLVLRLD